MKYCRDCKHASGDNAPFYTGRFCLAPQVKPDVDLVEGRKRYPFASLMRRDEKYCGENAKWFEPAEPYKETHVSLWTLLFGGRRK